MKKFLKIDYIFFILLVLSTNFSCNTDDGINTTPLPTTNVIEVAEAKADLTTFLAALELADLTSTLQGSTQHTVLAPTDAAFSSFLAMKGFGSVNDVPMDTLKQLLMNHVITGLIDVSNLTLLQKNYLETLADGPVTGTNLALYFDASNGVTFNGESKVTEADLLASNGVLHIVDTIVDLPTIETFTSTDDNFKDLDTAFDLISPVSTLPETLKESESGPFTLFAPTEHAFEVLLASNNDWDSLSDIDEALLTSILEHHVLNGNTSSEELAPETMFTTLEGDEITLNALDGNIEITDGSGNGGIIIAKEIIGLQTSNGIIHILPTQVMIPDTTN
ncbi:MAG: fasciclin domain-containing protein [Cyclobacteriaceae bacterium]